MQSGYPFSDFSDANSVNSLNSASPSIVQASNKMLINSLPCNWTLTVQSLVSLSFSIFHTGRIWPWNLQALLISSPDTCLTRSPYESYDHTYHDTTKFAALKAFPNHAVDTDSPLSLSVYHKTKQEKTMPAASKDWPKRSSA